MFFNVHEVCAFSTYTVIFKYLTFVYVYMYIASPSTWDTAGTTSPYLRLMVRIVVYHVRERVNRGTRPTLTPVSTHRFEASRVGRLRIQRHDLLRGFLTCAF